MSRPRRPTGVRRYHLTLDPHVAERLAAHAQTTGQPISTAAAALITDALSNPHTDHRLGVGDARRQVEDLSVRLQVLQSQLTRLAGRDPDDQPVPRWEWPVEVLLDDAQWWDRWLPRLLELLGRRVTPMVLPPRRSGEHTAPHETFLDDRGYNDLLSFLLPPIVSHGRRLTWRSPGYPAAVRAENVRGQTSRHAPSRADVWEPVIRHVAEALALLESTGDAGADPYMRLRAEAEITGPWIRILLYLVGEDEPQLPRRQPV